MKSTEKDLLTVQKQKHKSEIKVKWRSTIYNPRTESIKGNFEPTNLRWLLLGFLLELSRYGQLFNRTY